MSTTSTLCNCSIRFKLSSHEEDFVLQPSEIDTQKKTLQPSKIHTQKKIGFGITNNFIDNIKQLLPLHCVLLFHAVLLTSLFAAYLCRSTIFVP